jgi:hypothetical protein
MQVYLIEQAVQEALKLAKTVEHHTACPQRNVVGHQTA